MLHSIICVWVCVCVCVFVCACVHHIPKIWHTCEPFRSHQHVYSILITWIRYKYFYIRKIGGYDIGKCYFTTKTFILDLLIIFHCQNIHINHHCILRIWLLQTLAFVTKCPHVNCPQFTWIFFSIKNVVRINFLDPENRWKYFIQK